jgi:integrase
LAKRATRPGPRASAWSGCSATTGIRISEALALDARDVDLEIGVLTIRWGKRGKARLVPIDSSVTQRLRDYADERNRLLGFSPHPFFVGNRGAPHRRLRRSL